jgi:hypothetical protein
MNMSVSQAASELTGISRARIQQIAGSTVTPSEESAIKAGRPGRVNKAECETCKQRRYQDGSDENVSFKSARHMSPTEAGNGVRAHEQEHVANAYTKAAESGGKVLQASVSLHTSVCPECGSTYISGGTTKTRISYPDEKNPYQSNMKGMHKQALEGMNFDKTV